MRKITIAFDVDGTLRDNTEERYVKANERIRTLLVILHSFKNVEIMVWSGGGELYARQCVHELGLQPFVNSYGDKQIRGCEDYGCPAPDPEHWHFANNTTPDICIDDIQDFDLGTLNLIVREK